LIKLWQDNLTTINTSWYIYNNYTGDDMEKETAHKQSKKLILNFDAAIHSEVKQRAARRGISMNTWILRAIKMRMLEEDKTLKE
jgi:predicted HicB family RNase H-like nuclease